METSRSVPSVLNYFYDNADLRVRDKPFMGSPYAICAAYAVYVLMIKKVLPKFMENRKPVNYKKFMTLVDGILCFRSFFVLFGASYLWFFHYNWQCQPIALTGSWLSVYESNISYAYVVTMFVYTLQSVVFVACKKDTPVATYLLIHHTAFPLMVWIGVNFYPGGHVTFIGLINAIVHFTVTFMRVVTYFYPGWFLADYRRGIDVNMHFFQFMSLITHSAQLLFKNDCNVPTWIPYYEITSTFFIAFIYKHYVIDAGIRKQEDQVHLKEEKKCDGKIGSS